MGNLSAHFDKSEFRCQCGCGGENPSKKLIERLEKMFTLMDAQSIIVTSGYRCPNYSVSIGGYRNDAHTCNIAADIIVNKQGGGTYTSEDIAEAAERIGFGGIGLMNGACHVDNRDSESYVNNHWFGDERDGRNNIKTFQRGTVFPGEQKKEPAKDPAPKLRTKEELLAELKALYEKYSI
jgi:hypothetical protein